jgi:hypothetical protein
MSVNFTKVPLSCAASPALSVCRPRCQDGVGEVVANFIPSTYDAFLYRFRRRYRRASAIFPFFGTIDPRCICGRHVCSSHLPIPFLEVSEIHAAADLSSLSAPRATILRTSSGSGRRSAFASSHGARIQTSRSSSVVRMTGIALGSAQRSGDVVRKP